jgi:hypothetical protein
MKVELIERDIRDREQALKNCEYNIMYLRQENERKNRDVIRMLGNEAYLLKDQLARYKVILALLREEEGPNDEMPKKI